jgi:hypothetical protein
MFCKDGVKIANIKPCVYNVAVKGIECIMTKVIRFFDHCPNKEVLVFASASDSSATSCLPVLANLSPAAVSASTLPSAFSKSSSHN